MVKTTPRTRPGKTALSRERIVEAAIQILDAGGEAALTFSALTAHLDTGRGAIYWYVADKDELLDAATNDVVAQAMTEVKRSTEPRQAIRALALGVFDVIEAHAWVGAQLSRAPWASAAVQIFERIGEQIEALGIPTEAEFNCAAALMNYILGLAGQYAAVIRLEKRKTDRPAFVVDVAAQWERLDPAAYPFTHRAAAQLRDHDDRQQFLVGIDLFLEGLGSLLKPAQR